MFIILFYFVWFTFTFDFVNKATSLVVLILIHLWVNEHMSLTIWTETTEINDICWDATCMQFIGFTLWHLLTIISLWWHFVLLQLQQSHRPSFISELDLTVQESLLTSDTRPNLNSLGFTKWNCKLYWTAAKSEIYVRGDGSGGSNQELRKSIGNYLKLDCGVFFFLFFFWPGSYFHISLIKLTKISSMPSLCN